MGRCNASVLLFVAAMVTGCRGSDEAAAPSARVGESGPQQVAAASMLAQAPSAGDPDALAVAVAGARQTPPSGRKSAMDAVRRQWQGRRLTWEVGVVPALCRTAAACPVLPVDHRRGLATPSVIQGWLPILQLRKDEFDRLHAQCDDFAVCVLRFVGTLAELQLSADLPVSLRFGDVTVEATRAATAAESWVVRSSSKPS